MTPTRSRTRSRQPQQPMATQKTGLLPFFAGGAPAGIWGTGAAGAGGRKRPFAAAALGGAAGGGAAAAGGRGGGAAGFGVGVAGSGGGAEGGGGIDGAMTVAESSLRIGVATVA